jgi:hypothetical protein
MGRDENITVYRNLERIYSKPQRMLCVVQGISGIVTTIVWGGA